MQVCPCPVHIIRGRQHFVSIERRAGKDPGEQWTHLLYQSRSEENQWNISLWYLLHRKCFTSWTCSVKRPTSMKPLSMEVTVLQQVKDLQNMGLSQQRTGSVLRWSIKTKAPFRRVALDEVTFPLRWVSVSPNDWQQWVKDAWHLSKDGMKEGLFLYPILNF